MTAFEAFTMEGGPLDGQRIELEHDTFHPDTKAIRLPDGRYERAGWNASKQRVMRWTRTNPSSASVLSSDDPEVRP